MSQIQSQNDTIQELESELKEITMEMYSMNEDTSFYKDKYEEM